MAENGRALAPGEHDWETADRGTHKVPWTRRCRRCKRMRIDATGVEGEDIGCERDADGAWRRQGVSECKA